mmetsp:Transcript_23600/g.33911  ORF Transcript_23600/g.33911 Transcript_23600/m.33911 type:complete len:89 (-) Transcript_23600:92-358(-)
MTRDLKATSHFPLAGSDTAPISSSKRNKAYLPSAKEKLTLKGHDPKSSHMEKQTRTRMWQQNFGCAKDSARRDSRLRTMILICGRNSS